MPKSKDADEQKKYATEVLLCSKALSRYQQDFAGALLVKPEYTIEEAKETLNNYLRKDGQK